MKTNRSFIQQLLECITNDKKFNEAKTAFKEGWTGKSYLDRRREKLAESDEMVNRACYQTPPPLHSTKKTREEERDEAWDMLDLKEKAALRYKYVNEPCSRPSLENAYGAENLLPDL